jgi:hypothetical protein
VIEEELRRAIRQGIIASELVSRFEFILARVMQMKAFNFES